MPGPGCSARRSSSASRASSASPQNRRTSFRSSRPCTRASGGSTRMSPPSPSLTTARSPTARSTCCGRPAKATRSPTSPPNSIWRRAQCATICRTRCRKPRPGPGTRRMGCGLRCRASSSCSAILMDQTADGASPPYSSRVASAAHHAPACGGHVRPPQRAPRQIPRRTCPDQESEPGRSLPQFHQQIARLLRRPDTGRMSPHARMPEAWVTRNRRQVGAARRGADPSPATARTLRTVPSPTRYPRPRTSPLMRRCPQRGLSRAGRTIRSRMSSETEGRPCLAG